MLKHVEPTSFDASFRGPGHDRASATVTTTNIPPLPLPTEPSLSRKRKRSPDASNTLRDLLSEAFVAKPYPSNIHDKPRSLTPIALLRRSDLPLSALDRSQASSNSLPDSRFYESSIKLLDLERRMGSDASVLIARLDDRKTIYAVEYHSTGKYVLFRLGGWVDVQKLCAPALVSRPYTREGSTGSCFADGTKTGLGLDTTNAAGDGHSKKKQLAIEAIQSMIRRPSATPPLDTTFQRSSVDPQPSTLQESFSMVVGTEANQPATGPSQSPEEILDALRIQYMEALYLSRTSTAYFAKGPLSRARAAFHLAEDASFNINDLLSFLDGLILNSNVLDKKYKDSISDCISKIDPAAHSGDEAAVGAKKRKARKVKLGKDGLYNIEDKYLRSWWSSHDADTEGPGASQDAIMRRRMTDLRVRETQLQMILILETLALTKTLGSGVEKQELPLVSEGSTTQEETKKAKSKKARDLPAMVDVHVDRLCIWQSLTVEANPKQNTEKRPQLLSSVAVEKHAIDILKDFCAEVIVPFFSARLPSICDSISRKLGGPRIISPVRKPMKKSASMSSALMRPGAATKRSSGADQRTLERVLTDERALSRPSSRGPSGAISLMRSATMSSLPSLKREASETPSLISIPAAESQSMYANRGGVQKSKKFSQREVDMTFSALTEPKSKSRSVNIEAELKEAISALKKPNRQLAGQAVMDMVERRALAGASHPRKSKKPVRNPLFEKAGHSGLQIMATPSRNRHKNVLEESQLPVLPSIEGFGPDLIPPSSVSRIRSSGPRLNFGSASQAAICGETPVKRAAPRPAGLVAATPSKPQLGLSGGQLVSSPVSSRRPPPVPSMDSWDKESESMPKMESVFATPGKASNPSPRNLAHSFSNASISRPENIPQTPQKYKQLNIEPVREELPSIQRMPLNELKASNRMEEGMHLGTAKIIAESPVKGESQDIYKALGWDDDYEL